MVLGNVRSIQMKIQEPLPEAEIQGGVLDQISLEYGDTFTYLDTEGANLNSIEKETVLDDPIPAPVKKGAVLGKAVYRLGRGGNRQWWIL